jgi:hypothetical protein
MDILSLSIGFLVGVAIGAAGNYFAHKYIGTRHGQQLAEKQAELWQDIEGRFPAVIAEMRKAFTSPEGKNVRAFFVKESRTMIGFMSEPYLEFHTDKLSDLQPAVLHLARYEFITDITPGSCPMYRVHEELIDCLTKPDH